MREVNRVLKRGGVVALSTPTKTTDIRRLFDMIRTDLKSQGLLNDLRAAVDTAYDRHEEMQASIVRDTREDVLTYVKSAGLDITEVIDGAYEGSVMIVKAIKPEIMSRPTTDGRPVSRVLGTQPQRVGVGQQSATAKNKVFICYAREDEQWRDRLLTYMQPALRSGEVEIWTDKEIRLGDPWQAKIQKSVGDASAAVLLVSQAFLSSKYIREKELPQLLEMATTRGMLVIPVILETCMFERAIYKYPHPVSGPNEFRLSALHTAASNDMPMKTRDAGQQNLVLDEIASRLIEQPTHDGEGPG
jgi:hypothetical protein